VGSLLHDEAVNKESMAMQNEKKERKKEVLSKTCGLKMVILNLSL